MTKVVSIDDLIAECEDAGIAVLWDDLPENGSCSVQICDECYIGIDRGYCTDAEQRERIAHEEGHCRTGAFYNVHAADDVRGKHERRADEWAVRRLMPKRAFLRSVRRGLEPWEIADEYGVTMRLVGVAAAVYQSALRGKSAI